MTTVRIFFSRASQSLFLIFCAALITNLSTLSQAQTATYRLHREASSSSGLFQLKTAVPDSASLAIQTGDLKAAATGEKQIKPLIRKRAYPIWLARFRPAQP